MPNWFNRNRDKGTKSTWNFNINSEVSVPFKGNEEDELDDARYILDTVLNKAKDSAYLETAIDANIMFNINIPPQKVN